MFAELLIWFNDRDKPTGGNVAPRRNFKAAYSSNGLTWQNTAALNIIPTGISIATPHGLTKTEIDVRLTLGSRLINCRMRVDSHEGILISNRQMHKYGLSFIAMKRDDSDAVLRWLRDGSAHESPHKGNAEIAAARLRPDDVARLFPKSVQTLLHDELAKRGRLTLHTGREPLVAYVYAGAIKRQGKQIHRLTIESKTVDAHTHREARFRTRFEFDDTAATINVLN